MISDFQIDTLTKPIIDRQRNLSSNIVNIIAKRVKDIKDTDVLDGIVGLYVLAQMQRTSEDLQAIKKEILSVQKIQRKQSKDMVKSIALQEYFNAKPFYDYRKIRQKPLMENRKFANLVESVSHDLDTTFAKLDDPNTLGFTIRDDKNPSLVKTVPINDAYMSIIQEAARAKHDGALTFDQSMKKVLKQLNDSGLKTMTYKDGSVRRIDGVARMHLMSAIRHLNYEMQLEIGKIIGADGIEISAHSFSAPDHEPIQGHLFTIENFDRLQDGQSFEDTYGNRFDEIARPIGEWNCRHFVSVIILDNYTPPWTLEDLEELKQANQEGYTTQDGKHYTMYECTQMQRHYETQIRNAKDGVVMARTAGNKDLQQYYETQLSQLNKEYRTFSKACGLKTDRSRTFVDDYMKKESAQ